ncbi:hypothetical protein PHAVU_006G045400 [Phaseolus vulgaris]|uniref:Disease resistance protein At4g27190-like leucine-rich repeats domain-containing protein n=1 Tax=Phaseolus vulgaris TaxID=3885 RepID=V7BN76_PHAVU|nr:hypothetical protein PHAVU_006G045400g [Phaseolus vulgaris]ESW18488.1 hypothetical protein PHAVU_006G045400g [Phaseolus vulgaris]
MPLNKVGMITIENLMLVSEELRKIFGEEQGLLEHLSDKLRAVKEASIAMEYPEANELHLENLTNLKSFSLGGIVEWPSLKRVTLNHCPNIRKFGLGRTKESELKSIIMENQVSLTDIFESWDDLFSTIVEYDVDSTEGLRKIILNLQPSHFINLRVFRAKNCDKIVNEFISLSLDRSKKLEVIEIQHCKSSKYLFDFFNPFKQVNYFTQIKELKLIEVYEMKSLYHPFAQRYLDFRNLEIIYIRICPSILYLFHIVMAMEQLKEIKLEACEDLKDVVYNKDHQLAHVFPRLSKVELKCLSRLERFSKMCKGFMSLKTLIIEECPSLVEFISDRAILGDFLEPMTNSFELEEIKLDNCHVLHYVASFATPFQIKNLKKLSVSHCDELKMVIVLEDKKPSSIEILPNLEELILINLPKLTHIIDKENAGLYKNLHTLQVERCESLNWLPMPLTLKNMKILDCYALGEIIIVKKEEVKEKNQFSELEDVTLQNLRNLNAAFPSTSEFPSLETLKIKDCPSLMTFVEETNELKKQEQATSSYFFPNSLSLEKLKVLYIEHDVKELWHYSSPSESFCQLKNLTLSNNNKLLSAISSSMIIRFNNMKVLNLDKCELLTTIFNIEDDTLDHPMKEMLPQLRTIGLSNLNSFKFVWNKEPHVPFFSNLMSLFIMHCGSIESLFSLSSSKNLEKLKLLRLCSCKQLKEVIWGDKDENVSTIFPQMKCLVLKDLPKLVNFSQYNGTFDWPNLQTVRVSNVPSMKTFSTGNLNTPLLRSVDITFVKKLWFENLNDTISFIHKDSGMQF